MDQEGKGRLQRDVREGQNLGGPFRTKAEAGKRLRQIEFFKHRKG